MTTLHLQTEISAVSSYLLDQNTCRQGHRRETFRKGTPTAEVGIALRSEALNHTRQFVRLQFGRLTI